MFEDRTAEAILAECLVAAPEGVDIRQGSIFYDAVAGACIKIAEFYADIGVVFELVFLDSASGEYLDRRGREFNVFRRQATPALYEHLWSGTPLPSVGDVFFHNGMYFTLQQDTEIWPSPYLEARQSGAAGNNIAAGTPAVPMINTAMPSASSFGIIITPGTDRESDEDYRRRIKEKIAGPAENGNRQHYKTWAESVDGVGRARIISLPAGENTVMGVIIDTDGRPATQAILDRVQDYIDPITLGAAFEVNGVMLPFGDGLGDGQANIGAHFAAVAPAPVIINMRFDAELASGADEERIKQEASEAVAAYLKELNLNTPERQPLVVRISMLSAILHSQSGLVDYKNLTVNEGTGNITLTDTQVAVLGEVTFDVFV